MSHPISPNLLFSKILVCCRRILFQSGGGAAVSGFPSACPGALSWKRGSTTMCKKLVLAAVAILVGSMVVKHTSVGSLARVWWNDARQAVERQVPPETQIKRLEQ